jgi:hypothetical protein
MKNTPESNLGAEAKRVCICCVNTGHRAVANLAAPTDEYQFALTRALETSGGKIPGNTLVEFHLTSFAAGGGQIHLYSHQNIIALCALGWKASKEAFAAWDSVQNLATELTEVITPVQLPLPEPPWVLMTLTSAHHLIAVSDYQPIHEFIYALPFVLPRWVENCAV